MFEVIIILIGLAAALGLLALLGWIIYTIIKVAVRDGILAADERRRLRDSNKENDNHKEEQE